MKTQQSGWTPAMRRFEREATQWSFPYVRPLEEIVADYLNWAVSTGHTHIYVYPDGGGRTNTAKVRKILANDVKYIHNDIELREVTDDK